MKKHVKFLVFFFFFLALLRVNAQKTINIGAIIEDDKFLWTLESMDLYSDSTIITWKVKTKVPKIRMQLPQHVQIKDLNSGNIFQSSLIGEKVDSKDTAIIKRKFEFQRFTTCFPAINDSAVISIHVTPYIYIDSLHLASDFLFCDVHKYKTPVYNHVPLLSKKDSVDYSNELYRQGIDHYNKKLYQFAIISFEKALEIERQLRDWNVYLYHGDDFNESLWLANCYYKLGLTGEAKKICSDYFVEPYDKALRSKADSLSMISDTIYDHPKLNALKEICVLDSLHIGRNSFRYAESLYDLGKQYSIMREFRIAKQTLEKAKNIIVEKYKEKNWLISHIYRELAIISHEENDILSAIRYIKKSLIEERETTPIIEDSNMADNYKSLANYYSEVGDWENGLKTMEMLVKYWNDLYENDPNKIFWSLSSFSWDTRSAYNEILSNYAYYLNSAGYPKLALRIAQKCDYISDKQIGLYYQSLGDYNTALKYFEKDKKDFLSISSDDGYSSAFLDCQNSIAVAQAAIGNIKKAIDIQRDIVQRSDSITKRSSEILGQWEAGYPTYASYLSNLARFYNLDSQFDSALVCEKKSLEIKNKYSPINSEVAYSYMNIGYSYAGLESWDKALTNAYKAFKIYGQNKDPKFYLRSLSILANCYYHLHDYANLEKSVISMEDVANQDLLNSLQDLTYYERSRFIEKYSGVLNTQIPMYAYYTKSDTLASVTYNTCLTIKGALLSSENSVKRIIQESKDYELKDLWEELRADKYILSKQLEKDSLDRRLNTDSLQNVIYNLEDSLILKCKGYDDITKSMKLKWQDVQRTLHPEDVAIEFLSFPINNDSVMYVALTLRKESKSPKLITLFEEKQLKNVSDTLYYQCKAMTDLIWCPLLPELKGIKNIYFSPTSVLYNIGIEYLPEMEDYNIYRLSSTRELVNRRDINENNRAVLYGGLDYDAKLDTLSQSRSRTRFNEQFIDHSDVRNMKYRGGQENLTHTLDEVEQIEKELKKTQWQCLLDTLSLGTEESFKSLSGKIINTLHIATHGFYYTPEESDNIGYDFLLPNDQTSAEDKSLSRSGLLMSGANHILDGDSIPEDVEDGILTAKEIADVDFRGLDLVVLSACQTGLGDISQGEGVFGLQRGFKKAGANSILMSLWEVNDEATQILMTQFYKNLVSGQSKRQSLRSAQKYLREYNNGCFNEPKYWAAFILLDGIEKN